MAFFKRIIYKSWWLTCFSLLAGCGGESGVSAYRGLVSGLDWNQGVYFPADNYHNLCETPKSGQQQGTAYDEKMWLRSWTNDLYLWYDEVEDVDPSPYTVSEYFDLLKTNETTPSGNAKDRFHFYYDTEEWQQRQVGIVSGYGIRWAFAVEGRSLIATISVVEPGSPADLAGLQRGDVITAVDGAETENVYDDSAAFDTVNAGLFPPANGESHLFTVSPLNGESFEVTLFSAQVATQAVIATEIIDTGSAKLGYVAFRTHNRVAQDALVEGFESFVDAEVDDLVLDLRYNGGGLLAVASQLAYMVAGPEQTEGKVFENIVFNDKHTEFNPFTGGRLEPLYFNTQTMDWLGDLPGGRTLPSLNLSRVFVVTSGSTCSASESIMNSLRGIDVEVIQIGSTTCGKPYGFYGSENCQNTYFSINLRGENDKGFGDYADGFSPKNLPSGEDEGVSLAGCYAEDDLNHPLGNADEAMLATAINYMETGECATATLQKTAIGSRQNKQPEDLPVLPGLESLRRVEGMKVY